MSEYCLSILVGICAIRGNRLGAFSIIIFTNQRVHSNNALFSLERGTASTVSKTKF